MKRLITVATVVMLASGGVAVAQSGGGSGGAGGTGSGISSGGANPTVPPSLTPDQRLSGQAPVGHRQPRRGDVPPEDQIDRVDPADAALDRKIKSICRGC